MIRKSVLLAALVALAPAALLAADPATGPSPRARGEGDLFNRLDTNHDGALSKDEVASAPRFANTFDQLDTNHDGLVTQEEMRAAADARREEAKAEIAARFKAADRNADGLLTKDEAAAMPMIARRFDQLDVNKDGYVSPEELAQAAHHLGGGRHGWKGKPGDPAQR